MLENNNLCQDNLNDIIYKKVINKELYIKKLTNKYIELLLVLENQKNTKLDYLENKDIDYDNYQIELLIELENIEIQLKKYELLISNNSIVNLDIQYHDTKKNDLETIIDECSKLIDIKKDTLNQILVNKLEKIECEEVASYINKLSSVNSLKKDIDTLKQDSLNISNKLFSVRNKLYYKNSQINFINKLIDDLREETTNDDLIENNNINFIDEDLINNKQQTIKDITANDIVLDNTCYNKVDFELK